MTHQGAAWRVKCDVYDCLVFSIAWLCAGCRRSSNACCVQVQAAVGSVLEPLEKFRKEQIGEAKVTVASAYISVSEFKFVTEMICSVI